MFALRLLTPGHQVAASVPVPQHQFLNQCLKTLIVKEFYVYMCLLVCMRTMLVKVPIELLNLLELGLQVVVSHPFWVLGTEPHFS